MKDAPRFPFESALVTLAAIVVLASATMSLVRSPGSAPGRMPGPAGELVTEAAREDWPGLMETPVPEWRPPPEGAREAELTGGLFTPPLVYFDRQSRKYAFGAPPERKAQAPAAGIELVRVYRPPYRLQLAGYFGRPGAWQVALVETATGRVHLLRPGERNGEIAAQLLHFEFRASAHALESESSRGTPIAVADIRDEQSGADVRLESGNQRPADHAEALLRVSADPPGDLRRVFEGANVAVGTAVFRVGRIRLEPAWRVELLPAGDAAMSAGPMVLGPEAEQTAGERTSEPLPDEEPRPVRIAEIPEEET